MKRLKSLFIIILLFLIFVLFLKYNLEWECIFKKSLHIACPGCGLTRSLRALLSLNLVESIKYNILGIPIFLIGVISIAMIIKDLIKNEETFMPMLYEIMNKFYKFIFIVLVITMIINNINGV